MSQPSPILVAIDRACGLTAADVSRLADQATRTDRPGVLVCLGGWWRVSCAHGGCGARIATVQRMKRRRAMSDLAQMGWRMDQAGAWRCPDHAGGDR